MKDHYRPTLLVKRLTSEAREPTRGSEHAVGLDLYADLYGEVNAATSPMRDRKLRILPGHRVMVSTGIAVAVPVGYYGRVAPRSGLANKQGIDVLAGVVDPDYRGEVFVILLNTSFSTVEISHHQRVAQLILEQVGVPICQLVDELPTSPRGVAGFGSTGL